MSTQARIVPPPADLHEDLRDLESEIQGWLVKLQQGDVKGSHAAGMLTMAFGAYEELLRHSLDVSIRAHQLAYGDVRSDARVGKVPLHKLSLGKVIACLRAVRKLSPDFGEILTEARLRTLDELVTTRNERLKNHHQKAKREETLARAPDVLRQLQAAIASVLTPLLRR